MTIDPKDDHTDTHSAEQRARPATSWRFVLIAFFVTFGVMLASIYWVIRTGKY